MTRVKYPARILADDKFVTWLIKKDKLKFLRLTHIKASSLEHKKQHNIMLEKDVEKVLSTKNINESNLRASFKGFPISKEFSDILNENLISIRLVLAMYLATESPYKTYIFTTKENSGEYLKSPHFNNIKTVIIKTEEDALDIIEYFWRLFCEERDLRR